MKQSLNDSHAAAVSWNATSMFDLLMRISSGAYSLKRIFRLLASPWYVYAIVSGLQLFIETVKDCCSLGSSPLNLRVSLEQVVSQNVLTEFELLPHEARKTAEETSNKKFFIKNS